MEGGLRRGRLEAGQPARSCGTSQSRKGGGARTRAGGVHVGEAVGFGGWFKVELPGLGDRMDEESAGSRLGADPGVVAPEHLVMER